MNAEPVRLDRHDGGGQNVPAEWLRRDDGSLWALDEYGVLWPTAAFTSLYQLDADVQAALGALGDPVDIAPLSVADTEVGR